MFKHGSRLFAIAAASVALSGCALFKPHTASLDSPSFAPSSGPRTVQLGRATQEGRQHLEADQIGLAIEAYQRALASGEAPAPALNGLGVAYARLGRYDTAERLFQEAMAIGPADGRYAINLQHVMNSRVLAMRDQELAAARTKVARKAQAQSDAQSPTAQAADRLVRVSRDEYLVKTVAPSTRPFANPALASDVRDSSTDKKELKGDAASGATRSRRLAVVNPFVDSSGADKQADRPSVQFRPSAPAPKADSQNHIYVVGQREDAAS